jgi:hypothetical protein
LRAFSAAFDRAKTKPVEPIRRPEKLFLGWPEAAEVELERIGARIRAFPATAQPMLAAGARKLVDYLDPAYAHEYLDRVGSLYDLDCAHGGESRGHAFTVAAAKYVAVAMAYDDVPRVADLKIRASRQARVRREVGAADDAIVTRSCAARCRRFGANGSRRGRESSRRSTEWSIAAAASGRTRSPVIWRWPSSRSSGRAVAVRSDTRAKPRIARLG